MVKDPHNIIPASPSAEAYRVDEDQGDVFISDDPGVLFTQWMTLARQKEMNDANAMALATVDAGGMPDVRIVLLKDYDETGLTFFTNTQSAKGRGLEANPVAALCFHWKSIRRQVRFRGTVEPVSEGEADAYFSTRARGAQIGAWASDQSRPLENQDTLERDVERAIARFGEDTVPRPAHWSGYRLNPLEVEFWVNRPFRLHERLKFERKKQAMSWTMSRLYP